MRADNQSSLPALFIILGSFLNIAYQQSHVASFRPVRAARIMALAQPTPLSTAIAPVTQFNWQAPHSMQARAFVNLARRPSISNTACGQTATHMAHPLQSSGS
jgi:hypothetical protein